jgi:hypothetical protein
MVANWGTAKINSHIEAILGRYYGTADYAFAVREMTKSLPADMADLMKANYLRSSKVMGMFDLFNMGKRNFKNVGQS